MGSQLRFVADAPTLKTGRSGQTQGFRPPAGIAGKLLELQRTAGNKAVVSLFESGNPLPVQRGRYDKYKDLAGSQYPKGSHERKMAEKGFEDAVKSRGKKATKQSAATALDAVLDGVKDSFTPKAPNWTAVTDLLFTKYLTQAENAWDYSAGGAGAAPIYVAGTGHCGAMATGFLHTIRLLAQEMKQPGLTATLKSFAGNSVTPAIASVVNTPVGPANSMAGKNHPVGNIAAILNAPGDPTDADYAGVNRGAFNNHTWVEVTLPTGGTRVYDALLKSHGVAVAPSFPVGYVKQLACDETGKRIAPPAGFDAGQYLVAQGVKDRAQSVGTAVEALLQLGLKNAAAVADLSAEISNLKLADSEPPDHLVERCKAARTLMRMSSAELTLYFKIGGPIPRQVEMASAVHRMPTGDIRAVLGN